MRKATFRFLGTGSSMGTPMIGCRCPVCTSPSPYNKRMRVAGLIEVEEKTFLIDAGPDVRMQLLSVGLSQLTGLILTHTHFDHIAGLDDLRPLCFGRKDPIPCLLSSDSLDDLKQRYYYLMQQYVNLETPYTKVSFQLLQDDFGSCEFGGMTWRYVSYKQHQMKVTGYILGNLAYISDIHTYTDSVVESLQGIEHLIVGALRREPSQSHFSIDEAIAFSRKVGAKNTYFTHIGHELEHVEVNATLPIGMCLAYDGLKIDFEVPT